MPYDEACRAAYRMGVRDAFDAMFLSLSAGEYREMRDWLEVDLAAWSTGEPPEGPHCWPTPEARNARLGKPGLASTAAARTGRSDLQD